MKLTVEVTPNTHRRLKDLATRRGKSIEEVVDLAIRLYLAEAGGP